MLISIQTLEILKGGLPRRALALVLEWAALSGYRLAVSFQDSTSGTVDMSRLIHSPDAGVFAPL